MLQWGWRQSSSTAWTDSTTVDEKHKKKCYRIVHEPCIHCLLCFSYCHNGSITCMRSNSMWPDPSVSSSLKVSVVGGRGGQGNIKKVTKRPYFLHGCLLEYGHIELTEEELQTNEAAHKVVKVNAEVWFTVAGDDDLMQGVVEREAWPNVKRQNKAKTKKGLR